MSLVLDASFIVDWLLSERPVEPIEAAILENVEALLAPSLFWIELAYVMGKRVARGQIDRRFRDLSLERVQSLGVKTDLEAAAPGLAFDRVGALSDKYGLTVYDSVYLELAIRRAGRLATFDQRLVLAATAAGVELA